MEVDELREIRQFSLYVNGNAAKIPEDPFFPNEILTFDEGCHTDIRIGPSVKGKEIPWLEVKFDDGHIDWFCKQNLLMELSLSDINNLGLIGKIDLEGIQAELAIPSIKNGEWDALFSGIIDDGNMMHYRYCFSWCGDTDEPDEYGRIPGYAVGSNHPKFVNNAFDGVYGNIGWRPILYNVQGAEGNVYTLPEPGIQKWNPHRAYMRTRIKNLLQEERIRERMEKEIIEELCQDDEY